MASSEVFMTDKLVQTTADVRAVLDQISFAPSCLDMGWKWEIEELRTGAENALIGWHVNTTFQRPDTDTGVVGTGRGRKEFVAVGAGESSVVKTAWLLAELIIRHELMEAFLYRGVRIFDPHHTVDELSLPHKMRQSASRG
jgi:hypothetical protein